MAEYALVTNDEIINVAVIEHDFVVDEFRERHDDVIEVSEVPKLADEEGTPWTGWRRAGPGEPFLPPPEIEPPEPEDG